MFNKIATKLFGSKNERDLKEIHPIVQQIGELEADTQSLSDAQLRARTGAFRERLEQGATLDDILPEAFATVREAGKRVLRMRHFDVQLIGGIVLHRGRIAEMKTGEGKTLVATLPAYLNALSGNGVHVVTVNDYLAKRDSEWMGRIYRFLGMDVGVIQHDLEDEERKLAYAADVTYGTNNEFGFDFLRDNMKFELDRMVRRGSHYAIVDEVDSILIDEARTPLIISGPAGTTPEKYEQADRIVRKLKRDVDYQVDEKHKTASLTEDGMERVEKLIGVDNLYDPVHMDLVHQVNAALRAHSLFKRDVDYVVKDGQVTIVDEFTGRQMPGRRWSDGLHQAVEAKERVKIERESQTYATITFQNYFRMYDKLAGMTGTAETEAAEFHKTYKLEVTVIPTNRQLIRVENPDIVYRTEREKFSAIVRELTALYARGQPVVVGTISIEKSERLSELLDKIRRFYAAKPHYMREVLVTAGLVPESQWKELEEKLDDDRCRQIVEKPQQRLKALLSELGCDMTETGERFAGCLQGGRVPHVVLNAKHHEKESEIVAQAGRLGQVTIATNMAGRGTDILLGGNPEFLARSELGPNAELDDVERWQTTVEKYRGQCQAEHDKVVGHGGLFILGSERHESRRIDNQLRGRAGRQGDPGASRFYLSLEDDLMRIFQSDRVSGLMQRLGMEEDEPIEAKMVSRAIERAQGQVEAHNFSVRKHLLEYDDVMNKQREAFYKHRREVLGGEQETPVGELAGALLDAFIDDLVPEEAASAEWDREALGSAVMEQFGLNLGDRWDELKVEGRDELKEALQPLIKDKLERKTARLEKVQEGLMQRWERDISLMIADNAWRDHLYSLDHLKEGIGLRAHAQRDPLVEYKRESFDLFERMWDRIETDTVKQLFLFEPQLERAAAPMPRPRPVRRAELNFGSSSKPEVSSSKTVKGVTKIGRNQPCPCGSGKKYKRCHGASG